MKFCDKLYIGSSIKDDYKKYIRYIKLKKELYLLYIIFMHEKEIALMHGNLLLKNKYYEDSTIIGLSFGKREGIAVLSDIIRETYESRGDFDINKYLFGS